MAQSPRRTGACRSASSGVAGEASVGIASGARAGRLARLCVRFPRPGGARPSDAGSDCQAHRAQTNTPVTGQRPWPTGSALPRFVPENCARENSTPAHRSQDGRTAAQRYTLDRQPRTPSLESRLPLDRLNHPAVPRNRQCWEIGRGGRPQCRPPPDGTPSPACRGNDRIVPAARPSPPVTGKSRRDHRRSAVPPTPRRQAGTPVADRQGCQRQAGMPVFPRPPSSPGSPRRRTGTPPSRIWTA